MTKCIYDLLIASWIASLSRRNRRKIKGRWSKEEHDNFLIGLEMYGKNWEVIMGLYVPTRTATQIRTHAQKYFKKTERGLPFPEEVQSILQQLLLRSQTNGLLFDQNKLPLLDTSHFSGEFTRIHPILFWNIVCFMPNHLALKDSGFQSHPCMYFFVAVVTPE